MEYVFHVLTGIVFILIGWKLRNSKVDKNTLMPGYTLEGVMRKRKVCGNIVLGAGGIYLIIALLIGGVMLIG